MSPRNQPSRRCARALHSSVLFAWAALAYACGSDSDNASPVAACVDCPAAADDAPTVALYLDMRVTDERVSVEGWNDSREVPLESIVDDAVLDWDLTLPVIASGTVRTESNPEQFVSAELSASLVNADGVAGLPALRTVRVRTKTGAWPARGAVAPNSVDYEITLPPVNAEFKIGMQPLGDVASFFPPMSTLLNVDYGTGGGASANFVIPSQRSRIDGTVVDSTGALIGFDVRAIDEDSIYSTGNFSNIGVSTVSTVSTTTSNGFTAYLPFKTPLNSVLLMLSPPLERGVYPVLFVDPSTLLPDSNAKVSIAIPKEFPTLRWEGTVLSDGAPVGNAVVRFESIAIRDDKDGCTGEAGTGLQGAYATRVQTGENGAFSVTLPRGEYAVSVLRPSADGSGVLTFSMPIHAASDCSGNRTAVEYTLPKFNTFEFVFLNGFNSLPLKNALVDVYQSKSADVVATGKTDATGLVRFFLPAGVYNVVCKPPSEYKVPWIVQRGLQLTDVDTLAPKEIRSAPQIDISGTIRGNWGFVPTAGLRKVDARAYWVFTSVDGREAIPAGELSTSESGTYQLLLARPQLR